MRYRWPEGKQSAAVLSFDFDAESGFSSASPRRPSAASATSRSAASGPGWAWTGSSACMDRLKLRATFYIPGWTVEHHLAPCRRIRDAGHEIGAHGNMHEAVGFLDAEQEEAIMRGAARHPGRAPRA